MWAQIKGFCSRVYRRIYRAFFRRKSNVTAFSSNNKAEVAKTGDSLLRRFANGAFENSLLVYAAFTRNPSYTLRYSIALSYGFSGKDYNYFANGLARFLIWRGVDIHESWDSRSNVLEVQYLGLTPLGIAATLGNLPLVKVLIKAGARTCKFNSDLCTAIINGHDAVVEELIAAGADVQARIDQLPVPVGVSYWNFLAAEEAIITLAAPADAADHDGGRTLLHLACNFNRNNNSSRLKIVHALIAAGANVNARDSNGYGCSQLQFLARSKNDTSALMQTLIDAGADKDINDEGNTLLHLALYVHSDDNHAFGTKFRKTLKLLICGVDPFITDFLEASAFFLMLKYFNRQELKVLGAALIQARSIAHADDGTILGAFIACGADIKHITREQNNALHFAARNKDSAIIQELLQRGLNTSEYLNMPGVDAGAPLAKTPLDCSMSFLLKESTNILLQAGATVSDKTVTRLTCFPNNVSTQTHQIIKPALYANPNLALADVAGVRSIEARLLAYYAPSRHLLDDLKAALFMWVEFTFSAGRTADYARGRTHISDLPKESVVPNILTFLWGQSDQENEDASIRTDIIEAVGNGQILQSYRELYSKPDTALGKYKAANRARVRSIQ